MSRDNSQFENATATATPTKPAAPLAAMVRSDVVAPHYGGLDEDGMTSLNDFGGLAVYLHAFRRRWLVSLLLGLLLGGAAGGGVWLWSEAASTYTASALLRVRSQQGQLVFSTVEQSRQSDFDVYKKTQQQLLPSRFVLTAALRLSDQELVDDVSKETGKPVAGLPIIQQWRELDEVMCLAREIRVEFPGDAEIMRVSLALQDPHASKALVNAVVQAYMTEVVDTELQQRRSRLEELNGLYQDKDEEWRRKKTELRALAETLGAEHADALSLKQQIALQMAAQVQREYAGLLSQKRRMESELKLQRRLLGPPDEFDTPRRDGEGPHQPDPLDSVARRKLSEVELDTLVQHDPVSGRLLATRNILKTELDVFFDQEDLLGKRLRAAWDDPAQLEDELRSLREASNQAANSDARPRHAQGRLALGEELRREFIARLQETQARIKARREKLQETFQRTTRSAMITEIGRLGVQIEILNEQIAQTEVDLNRATQETGAVGGSSIEIETAREEIDRLAEIIRRIAQERGQLDIELRAGSRVTVIEPAARPKETDQTLGAQLAILSLLGGFCLPIMGFTLWEVRARRVNSSAEISAGLGLDVIGAIPSLPWGGERLRIGRSQRWRTRLRESVNGVAAMLLKKAEVEDLRVILVSSAVSGEGKTTLSSQLAMSLARCGYRTVLVDFDLRRPAVDELFDLPLEPGVSEVLLKEYTANQAIRETQLANLVVLTAGLWRSQSQSLLTNGSVGSLFAELRADYEFVVVDGGPILPMVDTRLIGQRVDGVLLSILRDVSQIDKVQSACNILSSFDIRILGAVVAGASDGVYNPDLEYEPYTSA